MGWDGTLWGIDAKGAPHVYDALNDAWVQHGDGIDAVVVPADFSAAYVFRGSQVFTVKLSTMQASAPTTIAALWPNLPDSFKLGVVGACPSGKSKRQVSEMTVAKVRLAMAAMGKPNLTSAYC